MQACAVSDRTHSIVVPSCADVPLFLVLRLQVVRHLPRPQGAARAHHRLRQESQRLFHSSCWADPPPSCGLSTGAFRLGVHGRSGEESPARCRLAAAAAAAFPHLGHLVATLPHRPSAQGHAQRVLRPTTCRCRQTMRCWHCTGWRSTRWMWRPCAGYCSCGARSLATCWSIWQSRSSETCGVPSRASASTTWCLLLVRWLRATGKTRGIASYTSETLDKMLCPAHPPQTRHARSTIRAVS